MAKPKPLKPAERSVLGLTVLRTERISPRFLRITVGGEALVDLTPAGFDQWFRVFVPNGDTMRPPTRTDLLWYAEYLLTPRSKRPIGRNLTVRAVRPGELDADLYLHDDDHASALAGWATTVEAGSPFAMLDEGRLHNPPADAGWQLLAGDESALPAIIGILESAGPDLQGRAFIELGDPADAQEVVVPDGCPLTWLHRTPDQAHGDQLLGALAGVELPSGQGYAYVAGSSRLIKEARRLLIKDRGLPDTHVSANAYWR